MIPPDHHLDLDLSRWLASQDPDAETPDERAERIEQEDADRDEARSDCDGGDW